MTPLSQTQERMAAIINPLLEQLNPLADLVSNPDPRTREEYEAECETYLAECRRWLNDVLWQAHLYASGGRIRTFITNATDRAFEDVEVVLYVSGGVSAADPENLDEHYDCLPPRPRPFGQRIPVDTGILLRTPGFPALVDPSAAFRGQMGPDTDNSASARVTLRPITLRPHAREELDPIILATSEPPGASLRGTWSATATNADGRVQGEISVSVSRERPPLRAMIEELARPDDSEA